MKTVSEFHEMLELTSGAAGLYFQPPENVKMDYPAITYTDTSFDVKYADNIPFFEKTRYTVIVIDADPESTVSKVVKNYPYSRRVTKYVKNNLNHFVFDVFF